MRTPTFRKRPALQLSHSILSVLITIGLTVLPILSAILPPAGVANAGTLTPTIARSGGTETAGSVVSVVVSLTAPQNPIPSDGKIRVVFPTAPSTFAFNSGAATGVALGATFGVAVGTPDIATTANLTAGTINITLSGGSQIPAGACGTCTVTLTNVRLPQVSGVVGNFTVTTLTSTGATIDTDTVAPQNTMDNLAAGALTGVSVTPASLIAGATSNVTLAFTTANPIPAAGAIDVTFPAGFNVTGVSATPVSVNIADGTVTIGNPGGGQIVRATRSGASGAIAGSTSISITVGNVVNPFSSGAKAFSAASDFKTTDAAAGATIDQAQPGAIGITGFVLNNVTLTIGAASTAAERKVQATNAVTVTLRPSEAQTAGTNKIQVVFPAEFDLSGATFGSGTGFGTAPDRRTIVGQVATIDNSGGAIAWAAGASLSVVVNGVKNNTTVVTTGNFTICTVVTDGNNDGAECSSANTPGDGTLSARGTVAGITTTAGSNTFVAAPGFATQSNAAAGATNNSVAVTFTHEHAVPDQYRLRVEFPTDYNLTGVATTPCIANACGDVTVTQFAGTQTALASVSISGQAVIVTDTSGAEAADAAGTLTVTVNNVRNPVTAGNTGAFTVCFGSTTLADCTATTTGMIDTGGTSSNPGTTAGGLTITAGALNVTGTSLSNPAASGTGSLTINFTNVNTLPADGAIVVNFPTSNGSWTFNSGGTTATTSSTINGGFTTTTGTNKVRIVRNGAGSGLVGALSLVLSNVKNPAIAGTTTNQFAVCTGNNAMDTNDGCVTASAGAIIDADTTGGTIAFNSGALGDPSVTPLDQRVTAQQTAPNDLDGKTGRVRVAFTPSQAVPVNGSIVVTFPSDFTIPTAPGTVNNITNVAGAGTMTAVGNNTAKTITVTLTGTTNIAAGAAVSFNLGDGDGDGIGTDLITFSTLANATSGTFSIATRDATPGNLDTVSGVAGFTATTGTLTGGSIGLSTTDDGASPNVTVTFVATDAVPATGTIVVDFPSSVNPGNTPAISGGTGFTGTAPTTSSATAGAGNPVTIALGASTTIAAGATVSFVINGATNGATPSAGANTTWDVQTFSAAGTSLRGRNNAVSGSPITGAATITAVAQSSLAPGGTSTIDVTFNNTQAVTGGVIIVHVPSTYTVPANPGATVLSQGNGTFTLTSATTTGNNTAKTIVVTGATLTAGVTGAQIRLGGTNAFTNPSTGGDQPDEFQLCTRTSGGSAVACATNSAAGSGLIDVSAAVDGPNMTALGAIVVFNAVGTSLVAGATTSWTISFTTINTLPSDGKIVVTFPAGFDLSALGSTATSSTMDGTLTVTRSGQVVTVTRAGGAAQVAAAESIVLTGIRNPLAAGDPGTWTLSTTDSTGGIIDQAAGAAAAGDTITGGVLNSATVTGFTNTLVGASNTATVTFTPSTNESAGTDKIQVVFPANFTFGTVAIGSISGLANTTAANYTVATSTAVAAAPTVTISKTASDIDWTAGTAVSFTLSSIVNPSSVPSPNPGTLKICTVRTAANNSGADCTGGTPLTPPLTDRVQNIAGPTISAAGVATKLGFTTQPGGGTAGIAWSQQPIVAVQDSGGTTVTTDNSSMVTLAISSGGTLTCTSNPVTVSLGVATFSGCASSAGTFTLTATATGLTSAVSSSFTVAAPATSGGGGGGTTTPTAPAPAPAPSPGSQPGEGTAPVSGSVGAAGGTIGDATVDGGASVNINPAAIPGAVSGSVNVDNVSPGVTVSGGTALNVVIDVSLTFSGLAGANLSAAGDVRLKAPLEVTVNLSAFQLGINDVNSLVACSIEGFACEPKPTRVVDAAQHIVAFTTDHVSKFTLLGVTQPGPALSEPASGTDTGLGPLLKWTNPAGTNWFQIQVVPFNQDGPGINLAIGDRAMVQAAQYQVLAPSFGGADRNFVMLPDTTYFWKVRTATTIGQPVIESGWTAWSNPRTFHTATKSSAGISLSSPAAGSAATSLTPALVWANADPEVFYYEVQVSRDQNFTTGPGAPFLYWELRHGGVTSPANSYTIPSQYPLQAGQTYFWRVRPRVQGDGTPVAWSGASSFTTP